MENCSSTFKILVPLAKKKKEVMIVLEEVLEITAQKEEVFWASKQI